MRFKTVSIILLVVSIIAIIPYIVNKFVKPKEGTNNAKVKETLEWISLVSTGIVFGVMIWWGMKLYKECVPEKRSAEQNELSTLDQTLT